MTSRKLGMKLQLKWRSCFRRVTLKDISAGPWSSSPSPSAISLKKWWTAWKKLLWRTIQNMCTILELFFQNCLSGFYVGFLSLLQTYWYMISVQLNFLNEFLRILDLGKAYINDNQLRSNILLEIYQYIHVKLLTLYATLKFLFIIIFKEILNRFFLCRDNFYYQTFQGILWKDDEWPFFFLNISARQSAINAKWQPIIL